MKFNANNVVVRSVATQTTESRIEVKSKKLYAVKNNMKYETASQVELLLGTLPDMYVYGDIAFSKIDLARTVVQDTYLKISLDPQIVLREYCFHDLVTFFHTRRGYTQRVL